jgi:four helix bundle protein
MRNYRDLVVWRRSHQFVLRIYRLTDEFPRHEAFGLTSQIRRASVSIPTNLAEGCGRWGDGEMGRFVKIAMGSASEVDYLTLLACDLGYVSTPDYTELASELSEIRRMLTGLYKQLRPTIERQSHELANQAQPSVAKS